MGLKRTNQTIVLREVAKMPRSGTLEEIKDGLLDVHVALMDLGIFQAVDVSIDSGNVSLQSFWMVSKGVPKLNSIETAD